MQDIFVPQFDLNPVTPNITRYFNYLDLTHTAVTSFPGNDIIQVLQNYILW